MEDYRVASHRKPSRTTCHFHHLQHLRRHFQFNVANVERILTTITENQHRLRFRVLTQHGNHYATLPIGMDMKNAQ